MTLEELQALTSKELNRKLAEKLGWKRLEESGGVLLGYPPPGVPHGRGQAIVPDYTNDWNAGGELMLKIVLADGDVEDDGKPVTKQSILREIAVQALLMEFPN
jgi:hypothetical protein